MIIYYLYLKTHKITGLQYLGFTSKKDPHKYPGSGKRWNNHLKKHGYNYETTILVRCISKSAIKAWGLFYSKLWSIVKSKKWANLKEENGDGGGCFGELNGMFNKTHTEEVKSKLAINASKYFKGKSYEELYGIDKANLLKKMRSNNLKGKENSWKNNPRYDSTEYQFFNIKTGILIHCTRFTFIKFYGILKSGVSDMINKGIVYNNWCILFV